MKEKKKFYVVTGGASGIGAACVKKLANLGVNVFLCDKDVKRGTRLAERVSRESGQAVTFLQIDLGDPSAVEKARQELHSNIPFLNGLINCAGITGESTALSFLDHSEEDWKNHHETNFMGAVRCIRAFQPLLKEVRGSIVNVSSVHGSIPRNAPCYSTTKAALENLTQRLAVEFGKDGIRVNAVAPGWIDTEGVRWSLIDQAAVDSAIDQFIPLGRLGTAEEVASVILFLLQAEASYVTGSVWRADGGWLSV